MQRETSRKRSLMTIEQQVLEKLRELSPDKKKEVLNFVDSLSEKNGPPTKLRGLEGIWADLDIDITEEDIAQARREMWSNFPRDIS
ncbi:MAG TPA: DUF2281 domain-containing protein [Candidatus Angelobacter sp.]